MKIYAFGIFSGIVIGWSLTAPNGHPICLLAIAVCLVWIVILHWAVFSSSKFPPGHRTHDNMGPEYEVILPLFFGYYWCRDQGSFRRCIKHESQL